MHDLNVHHLLVWRSPLEGWFLLFSQCCVAIRQTSKPAAYNVLTLEVQVEFMSVLPPWSVAAGHLSYRHAHVVTTAGIMLGERPLLTLCS